MLMVSENSRLKINRMMFSGGMNLIIGLVMRVMREGI